MERIVNNLEINYPFLIQQAIEIRDRAYAPYSGFKVGAALLCADGAVYTGCNIENASYGVSICAERAALAAAVSAGKQDFAALAVVAGEAIVRPCGICRQAFSEFSSDMQLICADHNGNYEIWTVTELMPHAFQKNALDYKELF